SLLFPLLLRVVYSFTGPASTAMYTLSLHDALPISPCSNSIVPQMWSGVSTWIRSPRRGSLVISRSGIAIAAAPLMRRTGPSRLRSEEHTSELQSPYDLVCRLLLEKKKTRQSDRQED